MNISFRQIEVFLAVADTLSFSRGAHACHMSQPALSANIKKLEEVLDARLFDRHTKNVALTAVGREFYGLAERLAANMAQAQVRMQDFISGKHGSLTVVAGPSVAASFAPMAIAEFLRIHPHIEVKFHDELSDIGVDMVRSGAADVALIPEQGRAEDLRQETLYRDHLIFVCPHAHPLAKQVAVSWRDIASWPQVTVKSISSLRRIVDQQLARHGGSGRAAYEVVHISTMLALIGAGLGVGVLPESLLERTESKGLAFRRINNRSAFRQICAVTSGRHSAVPSLPGFLEICRGRGAAIGKPG